MKRKAGSKSKPVPEAATQLSPEVKDGIELLLGTLVHADELQWRGVLQHFRQTLLPQVVGLLLDRLVEVLIGAKQTLLDRVQQVLCGFGQAAVPTLLYQLQRSQATQARVRLVETLGMMAPVLMPNQRASIFFGLNVAMKEDEDSAVATAIGEAFARLTQAGSVTSFHKECSI